MAAPSQSTTGAGGQAPSPHDLSSSTNQHSTLPVEMSDLDPSTKNTASAGSPGLLNDVTIPISSPMNTDFPSTASMAEQFKENSRTDSTSNTAKSGSPPSTEPLSSSSNVAAPKTQASGSSSDSHAPAATRQDSEAIGPATDSPHPPTSAEAGPVLVITLLLTSGARHPYKIDEKYLTKRNVNVPGMTEGGRIDPLSISVYTLKELILREWRDEWEAQPSSPSSIRLIFFGRLLDDKAPLKDCRFNSETPNVVHMTVRPQDVVDEEDASKSKALRGERDGGEETAGCRCVIL